MTVNELIKKIGCTAIFGSEFKDSENAVTGITVSSEEAGNGCIFAPILGENCNGSDYIKECYDRGCRVFLSEVCNKVNNDVCVILCENLRKTVAEIANVLYGINRSGLKIIGITGGRGARELSEMIRVLLFNQGVSCWCVGSDGVIDERGSLRRKTVNVTPEPCILFEIMAESVKNGASVICLEISTQALIQFRIYSLSFSTLIFSSAYTDSQNPLSFSNRLTVMRDLFFNYVSDLRILNGDDLYSAFLSFGTESCILCGLSARATDKISITLRSKDGCKFKLGGREYFLPLPLIGDVVFAAMALRCVERIMGKNARCIEDSLKRIIIKGRYERLEISGRLFIIDSASDCKSLNELLEFIGDFYKGRIITVFGASGKSSTEHRRKVARIAELYSHHSILTADDPGAEPCEKICDAIRSGFIDKSKCEIIIDRELAIYKAFEISLPDDVILIAGRGEKNYIDYDGVRVPFDEKEILYNIKYFVEYA